MNKKLLKSAMAAYGDTQATLADAMGISLSRFNAKVNERDGAAFTQPEMDFIIARYRFSGETALAVFFPKAVSQLATCGS